MKTKTQKNDSKTSASDRFGARKNTESAKINSVLGSQPLTVARVCKLTKLSGPRVRNHLRWLRVRNYVRVKGDGFVVRKNK